MKSIIFINFLLAVFVSTVSSKGFVDVAVTTKYNPEEHAYHTIPFGVVTRIDKSSKHGFALKISTTSYLPIAESDVFCQAFNDPTGISILGLPFGSTFGVKISATPNPVQIGSIICADFKGIVAQIKRAQVACSTVKARSPPPAEDVDSVQLDFDSEDDNSIDDSIVL